jgi:single-strand DNA-binding protein
MSVRSLNKVMLIGNLVRDPEMRYTPSGTAVATFSVASNRDWVDANGQKQEDTEFTRCVAWSKLAEICSQILSKGRKVYVEGRLQTRKWQGQDGQDKYTTEVVVNEMIALDSKGMASDDGGSYSSAQSDDSTAQEGVSEEEIFQADDPAGAPAKEEVPAKKQTATKKADSDQVADDIPF